MTPTYDRRQKLGAGWITDEQAQAAVREIAELIKAKGTKPDTDVHREVDRAFGGDLLQVPFANRSITLYVRLEKKLSTEISVVGMSGLSSDEALKLGPTLTDVGWLAGKIERIRT